MKTILFLSAGNDYRSRFSEYLFNRSARKRGLDWRAYSRGLATDRPDRSAPAIAPETLSKLTACGIPLRSSQQVSEIDFKNANKTIAIEEDIYRPLMRIQYPSWVNAVEYWNVGNGHFPLEQLEQQIDRLIDRLIPVYTSLATAWMGDDY